jgi:hypothetical protein
MRKESVKMETKKKGKTDEDTEELEETIDPYTGELVPVAEDADQFIEVVPEETDDRQGSNYLLKEETSMDSYAADADADAVADQVAHFTDDEDVESDFAERQRLAVGGRDALLEELDEHNSLSPQITGGDLDASWQTANQAGEEGVGGSVITPDQDIVDDLGDAAGLNYKDSEPLDYDRKVLDRDRNRWELNPASALDDDEPDSDDEDLEDDEDLDDDEPDEMDELDELDEEDEELDDEEDLEEDELEDEDLEDDELDDEEDEENA